jgi:hypothetical protein
LAVAAQAEQLRLLRDGEVFHQEVEAPRPGSWVVIDEVQRMPSVLDEVQDIISRRGKAVRFALTGSSARKLKRGRANLLAARGQPVLSRAAQCWQLGRQGNLRAGGGSGGYRRFSHAWERPNITAAVTGVGCVSTTGAIT